MTKSDIQRIEEAAPCLLDAEIFTCNKCGVEFDHTQGTWLPASIEEKERMTFETNGVLTVLNFSDFLKPPEVITSNEFTCYDCCP